MILHSCPVRLVTKLPLRGTFPICVDEGAVEESWGSDVTQVPDKGASKPLHTLWLQYHLVYKQQQRSLIQALDIPRSSSVETS